MRTAIGHRWWYTCGTCHPGASGTDFRIMCSPWVGSCCVCHGSAVASPPVAGSRAASSGSRATRSPSGPRAASHGRTSSATSASKRRRWSTATTPIAFLRGAAPPAAAHPVLLSVSRLVPYKNQAAVIRAAARFTRPMHVRLVGSGPEHDRLAGLARTGRHLQHRVALEYRRAGLRVPLGGGRRVPEPLRGVRPLTIEGIACGAPVAASDIPPHREFLGAAVEYFPLDDDAGLEAAVRRAMVRGAPDSAGIARLTLDAAAARFDAALRALPGRPVR